MDSEILRRERVGSGRWNLVEVKNLKENYCDYVGYEMDRG